MVILGISAYYHDSAAALIKDGVIIAAAEEERFNRVKHFNGFPELACRFCLSYASLTLNDVDKVVFYEKPFLKFERILRTHINYAPKTLGSFLTSMPIWLKEKLDMRKTIQKELKRVFGISYKNIGFCLHHLSHAALANYISPYNKCAILVVDAVGEDSTTSIYKVEDGRYKLLESQQFPHSLGLLYSAFTYYLGFKVNSDEYKVMGLAPYGDKDSAEYKKIRNTITNNLVNIHDDGCISLNDREFAFTHKNRMVDDERWKILFGIPMRMPNGFIERIHMNMALAIQDITEEVLNKMVAHAISITGEKKVCIVGGCALNCAAIGKLKEHFGVNNIYVPFAPGDDGAAIGCATYACGIVNNGMSSQCSPYLGPEFSEEDIQSTIESYSLTYEKKTNNDELYSIISKEIANNKIVGWFRGRMEFGPRALGNRSILADPRNPDMKDIINGKIKFRESFRPFAPIVMQEHANEIFQNIDESPYMSSTFFLKPGEQRYPAITHIDKTSRIQTVSHFQNPPIYELLKTFYIHTGCPMLLNTSFNVMGQPIVCSPKDAIDTFLKTGIDILVMNNFILQKS